MTAPALCPAVKRCAARFPDSVAVYTRGGGVEIRERRSGFVRGSGSTLARACKAALRRAR